jgi:hypothetical protein
MEEQSFNKSLLESALRALGEEAFASGRIIDISVYGGSSLVLATNFRVSTKDVDAVMQTDEQFLRVAIDRVAQRLGLPDGWLNDGVKTFLAPNDEMAKSLFGTYPDETRPGLRVYVPTPEYLLAMKLMAMRIDAASGAKDLDDILKLMIIVGVRRKEDIVSLAAQFYPEARVSGKIVLAIDSLWQEKEKHDRDTTVVPTWQPRRGGGGG